MEDNLLTISIPTYNGSNTIGNTIKAIAGQIKEQELDVCIFVSDNASTDNTSEIVKLLKVKYPGIIQYSRNNYNIGYDMNVDNCVRKSKTKYVWTFSDNEILCDENAVAKVINYLKKHEVEFLYLEHNEPSLSIDYQDKDYFDDADEYFQSIRFKSGLVTNCVFNRATWIALHMERYNGCKWIHMAYQIESLAPNRKKHLGGGIIWDTLYTSQPSEERWGTGGSGLDVGLSLCHIWEVMPQLGYQRKTKEIADFCIKGGYPISLIIHKRNGRYVDYSLVKEMSLLFKMYPSWWLVDLPVLLIPRFVIRWIFKWNQSIKSLRLIHKKEQNNV